MLTGWLAPTIYTVERDGFALRIGGNPREATTPSDFGLFFTLFSKYKKLGHETSLRLVL